MLSGFVRFCGLGLEAKGSRHRVALGFKELRLWVGVDCRTFELLKTSQAISSKAECSFPPPNKWALRQLGAALGCLASY